MAINFNFIKFVLIIKNYHFQNNYTKYNKIFINFMDVIKTFKFAVIKN